MAYVILNGRMGQKLVDEVYSGLNKDHDSLGYKLANLKFYLGNIHDVQDIGSHPDYVSEGCGDLKGCRIIPLDAHTSAVIKQKKNARSLTTVVSLTGNKL